MYTLKFGSSIIDDDTFLVCFHKEVFEKIGYYNEDIGFSEDLDFNIRANYNFKLAYDNSVQMSYFMQTENQLTQSSLKTAFPWRIMRVLIAPELTMN